MTAKKASNSFVTQVAITDNIILVLALVLCTSAVYAETYSWTDEAGNMHFTDMAESVPKKYRHKVAIDDDSVSRNWEYLASEYGVNYFYDASNVVYANRNRYRIVIKESYAASGREDYETLIMFDCARLLYKPLQSIKVSHQERMPVEPRTFGEDSGGNRGGYQRFTYPYQILARMICRDSPQ
jgi:hypothetical protein